MWMVLTLALLSPAQAKEEPCKSCWNDRCAELKDLGVPACTAPKKEKPKERGPAPCPAGKERNDDTAGQCCWPGQAWNGKKCVGEPTSCPAFHEVSGETCALPPCQAGMTRATDGVHCCWPGQAWSSTRDQCLGTMSCLPGWLAPDASSCVDGICIDGEGDTCISPEEVNARRRAIIEANEARRRAEEEAARAEAEKHRRAVEAAASARAAAEVAERLRLLREAENARRAALVEARQKERTAILDRILPARTRLLEQLEAWQDTVDAVEAFEKTRTTDEEVVSMAAIAAAPAVAGLAVGSAGFLWASSIRERIATGEPTYASGDDIAWDAGVHNVVVTLSWASILVGAAVTGVQETLAFWPQLQTTPPPPPGPRPSASMVDGEIDTNGDGFGDAFHLETGACTVCSTSACASASAPLPSCTEPFDDGLARWLNRHRRETGATWVWMPDGRFLHGCEPQDTQCDSDEKPGQDKTMEGFWMMQTEVTVAAYQACVRAGACENLDDEDNSMKACNAKNGRSEHPMNCVDWNAATAFCRWAGGRLPTAAEWEYAAKSGSSRIYPWGDEAPTGQRANFCDANCPNALNEENRKTWVEQGWVSFGEDDGWAGTAPVGSFARGDTPWGLKDMAGNVWEWTASSYDSSDKELRGGAWNVHPPVLRASFLVGDGPGGGRADIGFRCAQ